MPAPVLTQAEARFDRIRGRIGLVLAPLVFLVLLWLPLDLPPPAQRLAAGAGFTVVLWVTEGVPLAVAALLAPSLAVLLEVVPAQQAFAPLAHPLIFLFLGGFLLAEGLSTQGFDRRAALWLMTRRVVGSSPARAAAAVAIIAFLFSMWISNTATTAMMIPIALGLHHTMQRALADDVEIRRGLERHAGGMCLFLAYASSLGGAATPIGTAPNVIAMGFLEETGTQKIDFLTWIVIALPAALIALVASLFVFHRLFPAPARHIAGLGREIARELSELGSMRFGERIAVGVFGLAIVGWVSPALIRIAAGSDHPITLWADAALNEGVVALTCACLLFLLPGNERGQPILRWEHAQRVDWGTLLLLGGGLSLGSMMFDTGLAQAIGEATLDAAGPLARHPGGLLAVATLLVILLTEITSNTATTSMMLPVLIGIAQASNIDPVPTAITVTLAASCAFMLPVSTPPNAMAYGTGLIRISSMIRAGIWLDVACYVILVGLGLLWLPLVLGG